MKKDRAAFSFGADRATPQKGQLKRRMGRLGVKDEKSYHERC